MDMKKVSFRVKRKFYDLYFNGKKFKEFRSDTDFWANRLLYPMPEKAIIFCSTKLPVLEFDIEDIYYSYTPPLLLDLIKTEDCIVTVLKKPYKVRPQRRTLKEWL